MGRGERKGEEREGGGGEMRRDGRRGEGRVGKKRDEGSKSEKEVGEKKGRKKGKGDKNKRRRKDETYTPPLVTVVSSNKGTNQS